MRRFWDRVNKTEGCWMWTGNHHRQGYGRCGFRGNTSVYAHRIAWILTYGELAPGQVVCHHCDNPGCVRPTHLFIGTQKDNMRDCASKGRFNSLKGEANNKAVLTEEQAARIKFGDEPLAPLSRELGISYQTLWYVRKNITWKHICKPATP